MEGDSVDMVPHDLRLFVVLRLEAFALSLFLDILSVGTVMDIRFLDGG
jgi:hypothetical protein